MQLQLSRAEEAMRSLAILVGLGSEVVVTKDYVENLFNRALLPIALGRAATLDGQDIEAEVRQYVGRQPLLQP